MSVNWFKFRQERDKVGLIYTLLGLVALGLYWPVTGFDFINFDDDQYVTANLHVRGGYTAKSIVWAFTTHHAFNWHPITWLSHILDCHIYGLHSGGHHFTNVLFHIGNTLLLFGLLRRMTGALWRSAFVAALFAWHPLHVESVAWISERKDVLSAFFGLLGLWAYWFYVKVPNWRRYGLVLICFVCGLMSKPMLVTLPLLLLLLDYWPLHRVAGSDDSRQNAFKRWKGLLAEKAPFFILSIASSCVTYWAQIIQFDQSGRRFAFGYRLANALNSYACYIWKFIWPHDLSVFYPYPHHLPALQVAGAGMLLLIITALAYFYRQSRPHLIVGWLWFFIALAPVIGLIQVGSQAMADRYTYIPAIGLFLAFAWEAPRLFGAGCYARWFLGIAAMLILVGCLIATARQLRYWKNSVTLFTRAIEVTGDNSVARCNLAAALLKQGKREEALPQVDEALRINQRSFVALNIKGEILFEEGKLKEANECLSLATRLQPNFGVAHSDLGNVLVALGEQKEAEAQFRAAVRCDPDSDANLVDLGLVLAQQGRLDEAVAQYDAALRLAPNCEAENALGSALESQGKIEQAIEHYKMALKINPYLAEANCNLGAILADQGKFDEGVEYLTTAIRIKPDFAEAHYDLGNAFINQGKLEEASTQYVEAVRLKPDYMEAYFNLGNVMFQRKRWAAALTNYAAVAQLRPDFADVQTRMAMVLRLLRKNGAALSNDAKMAITTTNGSSISTGRKP